MGVAPSRREPGSGRTGAEGVLWWVGRQCTAAPTRQQRDCIRFANRASLRLSEQGHLGLGRPYSFPVMVCGDGDACAFPTRRLRGVRPGLCPRQEPGQSSDA